MIPFLTAIGKYGLASVLAGYLVYNLANTLPALEKQSVQILSQHQIMQQSITDISMENKENSLNTQKIMRSVCLILARNQQQIQSCNQ